MKVAILAGGVGTRLVGEEVKPKPMVEIGGRPILWHIMMHYAHYGFKEFVIALGYKGEMIKKYMVDYCSLNSNLTVNLGNGEVQIHDGSKVDWIVELVNTGIPTLTGGRMKRLAPYLGNGTFMLTWGDSVSDVNLHDLKSRRPERGGSTGRFLFLSRAFSITLTATTRSGRENRWNNWPRTGN
jgi:glucose-1-phosphate cytidylyltransferase